jgi:hypothetical protein
MTAPAIFLIPVAFYAIEHLFSGRKSAREQEVAERRPLDSAIPVQQPRNDARVPKARQ